VTHGILPASSMQQLEMNMAWTETTRQNLLSKAKEIGQKLTGPAIETLSLDEMEELDNEEVRLLEEYAENIPFTSLSRCPFCNSELMVAIDLIGMDGPWWWATCPVSLPEHDACEHFQFFQGALDLHDRYPREVYEGVMVGPAVPFMIKRISDMNGVKAVVSQFDLVKGDTAYLIAYFAEQAIDQSELHQEWRKEWYALVNADGEIVGTESKFDPWDFDLAPYIESDKLLWIDPGDASLKLHNGLPSPYVGLKGTQQRQIIQEGEVQLWAAPEGQESSLFESA
jgi:hypothetical protein